MDYDKIKKNYEARGYQVSVFQSSEEAAEYLDAEIDGKTVGFGDSETLITLGLYDRLVSHNTVFDPMHSGGEGPEAFFKMARNTLTTDVFLTSVNGATVDGEMVNIDGSGNRVAGSLFGHEKVYFVFGRNKLEPTLDEAIGRARNFAAPQNCIRHGFTTPCAVLDPAECHDCRNKDRICNVLSIYYMKMRFIEAEVIIIDEDLGL